MLKRLYYDIMYITSLLTIIKDIKNSKNSSKVEIIKISDKEFIILLTLISYNKKI
jgi:hypothetical protein